MIGDDTRILLHQIAIDADELEMRNTTARDGEMTTEAPAKKAQGNAPTARREVIGEDVNTDEESTEIAQIVAIKIDVDGTGIHPKTGTVTADNTVTGTNMITRTGHPEDVEAEVYPSLVLQGDEVLEAHLPRKRIRDRNVPFLLKQTHTHPPTYPRKTPLLRPQKRRSPISHLPVV